MCDRVSTTSLCCLYECRLFAKTYLKLLAAMPPCKQQVVVLFDCHDHYYHYYCVVVVVIAIAHTKECLWLVAVFLTSHANINNWAPAHCDCFAESLAQVCLLNQWRKCACATVNSTVGLPAFL